MFIAAGGLAAFAGVDAFRTSPTDLQSRVDTTGALSTVNKQESTLRKRLPLAIQSVVSIALLVLLFRSLDLAALRHLYATMPLGFYLISLAVVIGGQALCAWRWRQVLSASGVAVTVGTAIRQ